MRLNRRAFTSGAFAGAALASLPFSPAIAQRSDRMNILCWEGYNSDDVLGPFRRMHLGATIRAESGTSDPDMVNRLRAGEVNVWDLINLNQPFARQQLYPAGLIKPLNKDRFMPFFEKMGEFSDYPLSFADDGELIGMPQRYGPFSFVVNTDVISRETAEDQGWKLFLDPAMAGRYGVLSYDNWNVIHLCLAADLNPFVPLTEDEKALFKTTTETILGGARLLTDDLVAMNTAMINGEIDAYFTGGTYTSSPARYDGFSNVRAITPNSGPVDGKGGIVWVELTSAVNNPDPSTLAEEFLAFVQQPDISKVVAFSEGTYNPVTQMADPEVFAKFSADELDAIQWDSLDEEMSRSVEFGVVADEAELTAIYLAARRG